MIKDSLTLSSFQYNFSEHEKQIDNGEKVILLKELIESLDTSSCYYFTGFETFADFQRNMQSFEKSFPIEMENNIHLLKINSDSTYDFIYDRLNFGWDFQNIYLMLKKSNGWNTQKIPGFIIVDFRRKDNKITYFETYQWACCDFPYDYYYFVEQQEDTTIVLSTTAIYRKTEFPEEIKISTLMKIEMVVDSIDVYSLNKGKIKKIYTAKKKSNIEYISEKEINGRYYVFVRIQVDVEKGRNQKFNFLLGWIDKEKIKYVW